MQALYRLFFVYISLTAISLEGYTNTDTPTQLVITGHSIMKQPSDEAVLRLGVSTEATTAADALQQNTERMNTLISILKQVGMKEGEYQTGQFSLYALFTNRPLHAPDDWQPKIRGYHVDNKLLIRTLQIDQVGNWIDAAVNNGANTIDELSFGLHDPRAYRDEAIKQASANAKSDAAVLAHSVGVRLGKVLGITLDQARYQPVFRNTEMFAAKAMAAPAAPPIISGDVDVQASVTIVYEILQ